MNNTKEITDERGKNYGHPRDHFSCTQKTFLAWEERRNQAISQGALPLADEQAVKHGVYMILDKLSRFATNPLHKDNLDDIQGYARTIKMILGMEE